MRDNKGYTLVEVMIVVQICAILCLVFVPVIAVTMGNFYFTDDSIMKKVQRDYPDALEVYDTNRHVFAYSEAIVLFPKDENGKDVYKVFLVDSCITFAMTVKPQVGN